MRRGMAILLSMVLAGCVSVNKSVLTREFQSRPVPRDEVFVFMASAGDSIPSQCVRVAIMHASGAEAATEAKMIDKLREEAGKLGANAVFIQSMEEPGTGERIVSALFGTGSDRDADAIALNCPPDVIRRGTE